MKSYGANLRKSLILSILFALTANFTNKSSVISPSFAESKFEVSKVYQMSIKHHDFEKWSFEPLPGDIIEITNHSDIAHSIYITYPDGSITNLDVQLPGATVSWTVPKSINGDYLFQCWIHSIIRATLTVKQ